MTRTRTRSAAALGALLLSFLVYLLPLAGRHGVWFWGLALWGEFAEGYSKREALWLAADAGQAVILQVLAFALF